MYTYIMVRTQIYLSKSEIDTLKRLARGTGRTRSQIIREAIDQLQQEGYERARVIEALAASAGAWKRRGGGERFVERLRPGRLARLHE